MHTKTVLLGISKSKGRETDVTKDSFSVTFAHLRRGSAKGVSRGRIEVYSFYPETRSLKYAPFECFLL